MTLERKNPLEKVRHMKNKPKINKTEAEIHKKLDDIRMNFKGKISRVD